MQRPDGKHDLAFVRDGTKSGLNFERFFGWQIVKKRKNVQKSEEMREKSFQKTVLDRTTPKVGPNPVSRRENGALRLFLGVRFGGLNETKNVKKKTPEKESHVATQF